MTKEEIVVCLKNAFERNQNIGSAIESLINTGYTRAEIEEAARDISRVSESVRITTTAISPPPAPAQFPITPSLPFPTSVPAPATNPLPTLPAAQKGKGLSVKVIIIIAVIVLILLGAAVGGALFYLKTRKLF